MSTTTNYNLTLTHPNGVLINYKEVPVPNTSYSKVVLEDGHVAVILHRDYGGGWSTGYYSEHSHQLIFDSRLVLYLLSNEYKTLFNTRKPITEAATHAYQKLMSSIFPDMELFNNDSNARTFAKLAVDFIPENTLFRITEYDGAESVEILDMNNYISA